MTTAIARVHQPRPRRKRQPSRAAELVAMVEAQSDHCKAIQDRRPLPLISTEGEVGRNVEYRREVTLDEFIDQEYDDFQPGQDPDRAVWRGDRCLCVIHTGPDGEAVARRFDDENETRLLSLAGRYGRERTIELLEKLVDNADEERRYWSEAWEADHKRAKARQRKNPTGFRVTDDMTELGYSAAPGLTLDAVIAEQVELLRDRPNGFLAERVIWADNLIMAVIAFDEAGQPRAIRLDETPPANPVGPLVVAEMMPEQL